MAFFQSRSGRPVNGSEENSFATNFRSLPDNTQAPAVIKKFIVAEYKEDVYYQIVWQLVDGDFKGAEVKQTIKPFESDDNKAERALNMMFRIFTIGGLRTDFQDMPTNNDLAPLKGQIMAIKVGNGIIQGEERTWVREVWKEGELETCTGETKVRTGTPSLPTNADGVPLPPLSDNAFSRNNQRNAAQNLADDDVPF